jgi:hypothetical protein
MLTLNAINFKYMGFVKSKISQRSFITRTYFIISSSSKTCNGMPLASPFYITVSHRVIQAVGIAYESLKNDCSILNDRTKTIKQR